VIFASEDSCRLDLYRHFLLLLVTNAGIPASLYRTRRADTRGLMHESDDATDMRICAQPRASQAMPARPQAFRP